jgi:hypothetical protein
VLTPGFSSTVNLSRKSASIPIHSWIHAHLPSRPTPARVAEVEAAAHAAEPTDQTLVDQAQASPTAASSFRSEEAEELADALSPIYDQLKLSKPWWILEVLPTRHREQNRRNYKWEHSWKYVFVSNDCSLSFTRVWLSCRMNLGHGRKAPEPVRENGEKILVHRSVKIRMEAEGLEGGEYVPKTKFEHFDHEWVD